MDGKPVRAWMLAASLVVPALLLGAASAATAPTFSSKGGNEWWVQVAVSGGPAKVEARDTGGAWVPLLRYWWGDWAGSFHVEPGHLVQFRATMPGGALAWSCWYAHPSTRCATQAAGTPSAPTLAAKGGAASVALSWTTPASGGAPITGYKVYRGASAGAETFLKAVGVQNAWTDATAAPGSAYSYKVSALNAAGEGPRSNAASATPQAAPAPSPAPSGRLAHTGIVATTFWVGEVFDPTLPDGSQVCSTYDSQWAYHWSGVDNGRVPSGAAGCPGSIVGGCDGVPGPGNSCATERRTAANQYFPTSPKVTPRENPFYLDLPFDDLNDPIAFKTRCDVIPWANQPGFAGRCADGSFSYMKNHWVRILGPNGNTCYGQVEDAGPSHGDLYHDAAYVFGTNDARPAQQRFNNAGMDVSPALNGCLGFKELDGQGDLVSWQFVDAADVPPGPWKIVVTTSQVS